MAIEGVSALGEPAASAIDDVIQPKQQSNIAQGKFVGSSIGTSDGPCVAADTCRKIRPRFARSAIFSKSPGKA